MNVLEETAAFIFRAEMSLLPWRWLVTIYYTMWDHILQHSNFQSPLLEPQISQKSKFYKATTAWTQL